MNTILKSIFQSSKIIKLGMGVTDDLKKLSWSYPWMSCFLEYSNILDIKKVAKLAYPQVSMRELEGVSKLSVRQFSNRVDKSMQCSPWGTRPLTQQQLLYAGIDAWILTKLFDSLLQETIYNELSSTKISTKKDKNPKIEYIDSNTKQEQISPLLIKLFSQLSKCCKIYRMSVPYPIESFLTSEEVLRKKKKRQSTNHINIDDKSYRNDEQMRQICSAEDTSIADKSPPSYLPLKSMKMNEFNMPKHFQVYLSE